MCCEVIHDLVIDDSVEDFGDDWKKGYWSVVFVDVCFSFCKVR